MFMCNKIKYVSFFGLYFQWYHLPAICAIKNEFLKKKYLSYSCTHVDCSSSNALHSTSKLYINAILYEYEQLNVN